MGPELGAIAFVAPEIEAQALYRILQQVGRRCRSSDGGRAVSIFSELKRRNVFRAAAAYIVLAWLVIQVVETILPAFGYGDGAVRLTVLLLAIGLVPALIFAWAFEWTPEGLRKEADVDRSAPASPAGAKRIDRLIMVVLALAVGYFLFDRLVLTPQREARIAEQARQAGAEEARSSQPRSRDRRAIAVLPFETRGNQETTRFFADGVHDDLLTRLAAIASLKVISRTSVMQYRDTERNLREVGEELGATTLLEGGIQQAGDKVRINMQLIDAQSDAHLWARTYDRELTLENVFAIQSEIVEAIALELEATLSEDERRRIRQAPTLDFAAHNAYIRGQQLFDRSTFDALREAAGLFEQAIAIDPGYLEAHVALADTHAQLYATGAIDLQELLESGQAHIELAIEQDPEDAYAQAVLGRYRFARGDPGAEDSFRTAIALNPNSVKALDIYSDYLRDVHRHADALDVIARALELDPLSVTLYHDLGRSLTFLGRFDEAQDAFDRIAQINPGNPYAAHGAGLAAILSGQLVRAAAYSDRAMQMDPADYENPATSALIYLSIGDLDMARRRIDEALALGPSEPYPLAAEVTYQVQAGAADQALAIARTALASELEDRWGSEYVFLRVVQAEALATERHDEALAWFRRAVPECLALQPVLDAGNIRKAVDLALLLRRSGAGVQADTLLRTVVKRYDELYAPGAANYPLGIAKVSALAALGDTEAALDSLATVVDEGWRVNWQFELASNHALDPLRDDPRFTALFERIRDDLDAQRAARIN